MPTTRQNILTDLETVIDALGDITTVEINRTKPVRDINASDLPLVVIQSGEELLDIENSDLGQETWIWTIPLIVISKTTDIEALLGTIHVAVSADDSRGGYAVITQRVGATMEFGFDLPSGTQAMTIDYEITYSLDRGTT